MKKQILSWIVTGIGSIGVAVSVLAYGEYKYYKRRISKTDELMPIMEAEKKFIDQLYDKIKELEALKKGES